MVIGGELNGLGVCRSLALGGVPAWVVGCKRSNPALWSRYVRPVVTDVLHGPSFVDFLCDLRDRIAAPAFLLVTDELALLTISEHRKRLEGLYRFRLPSHATVQMLHDKARFHETAAENGWPIPNGVVLRDRADLSKLSLLRPPLILKPADKRHFHAGKVPRLVVAENHAHAATAADVMLVQAGEVLVQETIEGPDHNIYFCLFYRGRAGELLGMFTGQKLASTPSGTGSTAFCIAAADGNKELERTTKDFLDDVNYGGFGGLEFKRDARDGRYLIIEPTVGRTDWQEEVATLAGVNIPLIAYQHELDLAVSVPAPADRGVVWQGSWIERIRIGTKPIPARSNIVDGFWRWDDPIPALMHYPDNLVEIALQRLRPWRLQPKLGWSKPPSGIHR